MWLSVTRLTHRQSPFPSNTEEEQGRLKENSVTPQNADCWTSPTRGPWKKALSAGSKHSHTCKKFTLQSSTNHEYTRAEHFLEHRRQFSFFFFFFLQTFILIFNFFYLLRIFLNDISNAIPKVPHTLPPTSLPTHSHFFLALAFPCTGAYKVCVSDGPLSSDGLFKQRDLGLPEKRNYRTDCKQKNANLWL